MQLGRQEVRVRLVLPAHKVFKVLLVPRVRLVRLVRLAQRVRLVPRVLRVRLARRQRLP